MALDSARDTSSAAKPNFFLKSVAEIQPRTSHDQPTLLFNYEEAYMKCVCEAQSTVQQTCANTINKPAKKVVIYQSLHHKMPATA